MSQTERTNRRRDAWAAMKAAIRAYSRQPTEANAERVKQACGTLRRQASDALWAIPVASASLRQST